MPYRSERRKTVVFFGAALVLAITTALVIGVSISSIRDSIWFVRIVRRMDADGADREQLLDASRFARRATEWRQLARLAWNLSDHERWPSVRDVALLAADRFPRDDTWIQAAAYAMIRLGRHQEARELLGEPDGAGELRQYLHILAALDIDEPVLSTDRLAEFSDAPEGMDVLRAIGRATREPTAELLWEAWEATGVSAYGVNAALEAAGEGNREIARNAVGELRRSGRMPDPEYESAPLYLAIWLEEVDWLFEQLGSLTGRRAVEPTVLLIQGEGMLQQGQLDSARRFYREIHTAYPHYAELPYLNDAAITLRLGDGDPVPILRAGVANHPQSIELRGALAGVLTAGGRRLEAAEVIAPAVIEPAGEAIRRDRNWLLVRALLGTREPVERLESDLWSYINDYPEAMIVAHYLTRFLIARNDGAGLADLRRRYAADAGSWATTTHLMYMVEQGRFAEAEALLSLLDGDSWTDAYNRALFAMRFLPLHEAQREVEAFRLRLNRGSDLHSETRRRASVHLALLEAELARLSDDGARARALVDRAIDVNPDMDLLYTYRAILAPLQ
ncbi:MAG: hypothetical protein MI724_20130 [Spirochaetales bacterium]|nr:hypothetical protein [Spirochaetales bacterium]